MQAADMLGRESPRSSAIDDMSSFSSRSFMVIIFLSAWLFICIKKASFVHFGATLIICNGS